MKNASTSWISGGQACFKVCLLRTPTPPQAVRDLRTGAGAIASAKVLSAQEMDMSHGMQGMKMKKGMTMNEPQHAHSSGSPLLVQTTDLAQLP
jgi:hypothetical protein